MDLDLKRIWFPPHQNPMGAPYEGYIDGKMIGILYYNPLLHKLTKSGEETLEKLGYALDEIRINRVE